MLWSSDSWSNILNTFHDNYKNCNSRIFWGNCLYILRENAETKQSTIAFKKLNYQFD